MFSLVKGKTRPLNTFYDSGCSDCVWKEGVPGNEIKGVITQPGPFLMGRVGDTRVKANNEYLCLMDLVDGRKQLIHGLSVDKITGTFPTFNLTEVEKELKTSAPNNKELQTLKVPPSVGGEVDCLLGIRYQNCHPVLVHSLDSGLSIFRVRLASHDGFNAVIGGPHKAFDYLAGKSGNTAQLVAAFASCINDIRSCGEFIAPKISSNMMTLEEEAFARTMNVGEEYEIIGELEPEEMPKNENLFMICTNHNDVVKVYDSKDKSNSDVSKSAFAKIDTNPEVSKCAFAEVDTNISESAIATGENSVRIVSENAQLLQHENCVMISCSTCGKEVKFEEENFQNILCEEDNKIQVNSSDLERKDTDEGNEESIKEMRKTLKLLESGVNVEYRCIKCRSCGDCKRAIETERISLREEAEEQEIWDSVILNFEESKIDIHMPVRGNEEEFLASNEDIAL